MNTDLCEWAYLWEINVFFGWAWVHICIHFGIKMDISQFYKTHADWCNFFFVWLASSFRRFRGVVIANRSTRSLSLICLLLLPVHRWRTAAVRPLSTHSITKTHNLRVSLRPLNFSAEQTPAAANVTAKAGSAGFVRDVILSPLPMATPPPPTQQSQTNDFDLSSAVGGRSYRYNPPNDVKDLSAKLMNDKKPIIAWPIRIHSFIPVL